MKYEKIKIPKGDGTGYWKYRLTEDFVFRTPFPIQDQMVNAYPFPTATANWQVIEQVWYEFNLHFTTIREGYAWDGMTCCPDLKRWLPCSIKHDVYCQAIHDDKVLPKSMLNSAHEVFEDIGVDGHIITMGLKMFHKQWRKLDVRR